MSCPLVQKTPLTCLLTLCLLTKHFILAPAAATTVHHICRVPHTPIVWSSKFVLIYSACGAQNFSVLIYSHVEPIHPYTGCSENKRHLCALTSTTSPQHLLLPAVKTVHEEAHFWAVSMDGSTYTTQCIHHHLKSNKSLIKHCLECVRIIKAGEPVLTCLKKVSSFYKENHVVS